MKVIATAIGFYDGRLIREGETFEVTSGSKARWFAPLHDFNEPPHKDNIDTVAEIKARLDELGVEYPKRATKAELLALLEDAEKVE